MADAPNFTALVPGFDFLQGLVKNAGAALPSIGQWVAPTLNPQELEKRIEELRAVQFWLEQNARMLDATIRALEVQRMTLSTLQTMNVQMDDLRESLTIKLPTTTSEPRETRQSVESRRTDEPTQAAAKAPPAKPARRKRKASAASDAASPVDPMQWWGALTKQFTELAATAMKDTAADAAKNLAEAMGKQTVDAAGQTPDKAASAPSDTAGAANAERKPASGTRKKATEPPT